MRVQPTMSSGLSGLLTRPLALKIASEFLLSNEGSYLGAAYVRFGPSVSLNPSSERKAVALSLESLASQTTTMNLGSADLLHNMISASLKRACKQGCSYKTIL